MAAGVSKLPPPEPKEVQLQRAREQVAKAQEIQRQLEAQGSGDESESDEETQAQLDAAAAEVNREPEDATGASIGISDGPVEDVDESQNELGESIDDLAHQVLEKARKHPREMQGLRRRAGRPRKSESITPELSEVPAVILTGASATTLALPLDLPFKDWKTYATYLRVLDKGTHWWLGDLQLYADVRGKDWEEQAIQYLAELGFSDQTLMNDKSVAKAFSPDPPFSGRKPLRKRHDKLSFEHHKMVAFLEPKLAEELLHRAEVGDGRGNAWTSNELRDEIRARRATNVMPPARGRKPREEVPIEPDRSLRSKPPAQTNGTGPAEDSIRDVAEGPIEDVYDFSAHRELVQRARQAMTTCQMTLEREKLEDMEPGYNMVCGAIETLCELRDSYERLGLGG